MPDMINESKVKSEMGAMVEMLSHPAFVAAMKNMKATPIKKRRAVGKKTLTVKALKAKGVPIPAGMRLTTRYFEPGRPGVVEIDPTGHPRITKNPRFPQSGIDGPGTVSWGGCACGGGLSFCGGAGGST